MAHVVFGVDDVVHTELGEDAAVGLADGFGPDVLDAEGDQQRGREDAGFEVGADGDDSAVELVDAQLAQGVLLGGVGPHGMGDGSGDGAHHVCSHWKTINNLDAAFAPRPCRSPSAVPRLSGMGPSSSFRVRVPHRSASALRPIG
ncbi:hypothetical protein GCM10010231_05540 [Streptomyces sindenensis]|nr:hypothetical protein GCM10010231_05540 [Streptomyces sindenensis]